MLLALLAAQDTATTAGMVIGRLLVLAVGVLLIVRGVRRRNDPRHTSRGILLLVVGVLLVLGTLSSVAVNPTTGT